MMMVAAAMTTFWCYALPPGSTASQIASMGVWPAAIYFDWVARYVPWRWWSCNRLWGGAICSARRWGAVAIWFLIKQKTVLEILFHVFCHFFSFDFTPPLTGCTWCTHYRMRILHPMTVEFVPWVDESVSPCFSHGRIDNLKIPMMNIFGWLLYLIFILGIRPHFIWGICGFQLVRPTKPQASLRWLCMDSNYLICQLDTKFISAIWMCLRMETPHFTVKFGSQWVDGQGDHHALLWKHQFSAHSSVGPQRCGL